MGGQIRLGNTLNILLFDKSGNGRQTEMVTTGRPIPSFRGVQITVGFTILCFNSSESYKAFVLGDNQTTRTESF